MAISEKLAKKLKASRKASSGEILRTTDGRVLFLTRSALKRATVAKRYHASIKRLQRHDTPAAAKRAPGCRAYIRWLLRNDPDTEFWRQVYVDWVNNC